MELPQFKYHPDPIATGAIEASDEVCECCGEPRGYKYAGAVYSVEDVETVCPWCIADGSVTRKFDATLLEGQFVGAAEVSAEVAHEVGCRTPSYVAWQANNWMACCNDACEFHGDAPARELKALSAKGIEQLSVDSGFPVEDLHSILEHYTPCGSPAFYKFVCRHCGQTRYTGDCD